MKNDEYINEFYSMWIISLKNFKKWVKWNMFSSF